MQKLKSIKPLPNRLPIVQDSTSTTRSVEDAMTIRPTSFVQTIPGNPPQILFVSPSRGILNLE